MDNLEDDGGVRSGDQRFWAYCARTCVRRGRRFEVETGGVLSTARTVANFETYSTPQFAQALLSMAVEDLLVCC